MKDIDIIRGCVNNDRNAQFILYNTWKPYLFAIAFDIVKNTMDAEDVMQESFVKIFDNIESYTEGKKFKAWLATIVKNTAITYWNRNSKHSKCEFIENYEPMQKRADNFIDSYFAGDLFRHSMSILQRVSPNQYMYARLYFNYDMNYKEISEDIEVPEGTAKSQISRAKASLREIINDFDKKERVKSVA